jgi:uncharacterized protein (DUF427 family)
MKATWNNQVIAKSDKTIYIEGNQYFPKSSVKAEFLKPSDTHTTCPWKGLASYYDVVVGGQTNKDAAWYYPKPLPGSLDIVKQDFTNYIAFWHGVEVSV